MNIVQKRNGLTSRKSSKSLKAINTIEASIKSFALALDDKSLSKINILFNYYEISSLVKNYSNNAGYKIDIVYDLYINKLLSLDRLQFILDNLNPKLSLSSRLIKTLIKNDETCLLDVIFEKCIFFDNEFIQNCLLHYKSRKEMSSALLKKQIEQYKYTPTNTIRLNNSSKYLINACLTGKIPVVKFLVQHGVDINRTNFFEKITPLFIVGEKGSEEMARLLVVQGADINKENEFRETPIFYACKSGNEPVVQCLIEHGADVNKMEEKGMTPLFYACSSGNLNIVKYLVERGADINQKNKFKKNPLFFACKNGNESIVRYLIELGADITEENVFNETAIHNALMFITSRRRMHSNPESEASFLKYLIGVYLSKLEIKVDTLTQEELISDIYSDAYEKYNKGLNRGVDGFKFNKNYVNDYINNINI